MLKSYKELIVWQKAYHLCLGVYRATKGFPKEEIYGLTSQMRRAAVSVPCNIAEGYGRKSTREYIRSLYIAYGSICELETQILI
jgi:four helix bundle protein